MLLVFSILLILLLMLSAGLYTGSSSGRWKKNPELETLPENTYSETLRAVTDRDYKPFSYIREDGSYAGMDVEMIAEIANRLHMNLELELLDWNEAQRRLEDGEADVILNMELDLVDGSSGLIATIPTEVKEYVVYGHHRVTYFGELFGKRIGSMQMFPELGLDQEIRYVPSYREMFEKLDSGEFDYIFCPLQVGDTFLGELEHQDIVSSLAISQMYGCIALNEKNTDLRDRINEVIREIQSDGTIEHLDAKWVIHYENVTLSGFFRNHTTLLIVIAGAFLGVILLAVVTVKDASLIRLQESYTEELREKVETIEKQNSELEEEKIRAEAASRAKSAFLFSMSHDIRTPMNAILGSVEMARLHIGEPEEIQGCLNRISCAGKDLLQMLNGVLDMAEMEDGHMTLDPVSCSLPDFFREIGATAGEIAERKQQTLTVSIGDLPDSCVFCDSDKLRQILLHLISNAVKFTPEGGNIRLGLRQLDKAEDDRARYEFCVADNGCGMNPEFASKAFEAFEREQTSTASGRQGFGLGLTIVKKITDCMEGTVRLNTAPDKGTEVFLTFSFPVCRKHEEDIKPGDEPDLLVGKNILLVDDIEINREIAEMLLESMGCLVHTAENGREAVEAVQSCGKNAFDLILMDIQMPVMDGYEAARAVREEGFAAPILALTANTSEEDIRNALESGMDDVIPKPVSPEILSQVMLRNLGQTRYAG